jgi:hypothetical protein
MSLNTIFEQMTALLDELAKIDFGYPLGENVVRLRKNPIDSSAALETNGECGARWLSELYAVCDGLSFPDVHVGYFIKPLQRVIAYDRSSEPDKVFLGREIRVVPIGSTGGGSLFVVECESGNVLLLPPGLMKEGRYDATNTKTRVVAPGLVAFLELLLADLRAFVNDDSKHAYIAAV